MSNGVVNDYQRLPGTDRENLPQQVSGYEALG